MDSVGYLNACMYCTMIKSRQLAYTSVLTFVTCSRLPHVQSPCIATVNYTAHLIDCSHPTVQKNTRTYSLYLNVTLHPFPNHSTPTILSIANNNNYSILHFYEINFF